MSEEEEVLYEYDLVVDREMFYSEQTMWGAYSFKFEDREEQFESGVKLHTQWNNFVISGNVFKLDAGKSYKIVFTDSYTEKYGDGYEFVEVKSDGLKDRDAQMDFLEVVLSSTMAENIAEQYEGNDDLLNSIIDGRIDLHTVKGIQKKQIPTYLEKIKQISTYQEAIVKLAPLGASVKTIVNLADNYGGSKQLMQIIDEDVYRLTEAQGFGFKKVDDFALRLGYPKDSRSRILAGSTYALEQMSNFGDIKIPIEDFDEQMCKILEIDEVDNELFEQIMSGDQFYYGDGHIALTSLRNEEKYIARRLTQINVQAKELPGYDIALEQTIAEQEEINGFKFVEEQLDGMRLLKDNGIAIVNGKAGSGKTAIAKAIVETFRKLSEEYSACALSGTAVKVLQKNGLNNAQTIHRMLGWNPYGGFEHNEESPLMSNLIILDEASMVNNTLYVSIVKAIRQGARFLIIGDSGQLPPIGHGAVFENLLRIDSIPRVELTKIHRQAAKSGVITTANDIRNHKQINDYGSTETQVLGELKDMMVFNYIDKTLIYDDIISTVERFNMNPNKDNKGLQVLTAMKRGELGVPKLNEGIQEVLNPSTKGKPFVKNKGMEFRLGDRVIQNGNFYDAIWITSQENYQNLKSGIMVPAARGKNKKKRKKEDDLLLQANQTAVFNGSIGYIVDIHQGKHVSGILVEYENYSGREQIFYLHGEDESDIGQLDLAYAITTHRSQGSGFETVLFAFDYSAYMLLSKEFVYTGITRTINNCIMFVENQALHYAIKNTQSANRQTYLKEFIEKMQEEIKA